MIWSLFALHVVAMVAAAVLGRRSTRLGLAAAAAAPAASALWFLLRLANPATDSSELVWVEALDLVVRFRTGPMAVLMAAIVSGIGALVFVYAIGYFDAGDRGGHFPAALLGFSASMLGLVLADSIWTLFIFWEFTSVTSFLLVGHKNTYPDVQRAARRALMITGAGGLALLAGLLLLAESGAGTSLASLGTAGGATAPVAAALILVAVATKSAQVPFHVWLPGAMAAPTPVSAYLHSATMVKAGVLLMALTGSAFRDSAMWLWLGLGLGIASMLWGGIGALRQRDAKLILAWGTISQLGLMVTLLAFGTGKAVFAAVSILVAHALFKAALFMVVGEIDVRTGTRDIGELGGLHRTMPVATLAAVLAGLSMAGAPPLLGFAAKEAALEAAIGLSGLERNVGVAAIGVGSVLTVAYTTRFLWCTFGPGPRTDVGPRRLAMTIPISLLAAAGVAGFVALGAVNDIVIPAATALNPDAAAYELLAWPGLKPAFGLSVAALVSGTVVAAFLQRLGAAPTAPRSLGADAADRSIDAVLELSPRVTARIQHGSLPVYMAVMALTAAIAATPFFSTLGTAGFGHIELWHGPLEMLLGIAVATAGLAGAVLVTSRLGAALTLGAVGIGVSGIFVVYGAPDLALTQLLIETIIVVGFVTGLGHLRREFPTVTGSWRTMRVAVSVACGVAVTAALASATAAPSGRAPIQELVSESVATGGGNNVVNVILTDMRALDTLGEVVVLAVVALGIVALAPRATASDQDAHQDTPQSDSGVHASSDAQGSSASLETA